VSSGVSPGSRWIGLRERAAAQIAAAALRDAESMRVLEHARRAGFPLVVLKGLALAYTVYAEPWIRERGDTDLLVRHADIGSFDSLFRDLGYALVPQIRGELTLPQRQYLRADERGFKYAWDLHWRLTASQALRFALPEEQVWANAVSVAVLGHASVPSRADALLLACLHRLAHHHDEKRLIWLWDIRLLLEAMTDTEWAAFDELVACDENSAAAAAHSLAVARDWVGAPIPDRLSPLIERSAHVPAAFLWGGSHRRVTYLIGELRAARRQDRLPLLRERLFPTLSSMRERYPSVPGILLPLAHVWRLAIGIPRWIRRR
jgi:hypothetical protein